MFFRIEGVKLSEEQKKMPDGSKPEGALNEFIELLKRTRVACRYHCDSGGAFGDRDSARFR